ncbi:hypothetical protein M8C13_36305 [Crossiella sp. SN42]|uniref:hypothetical protein n=1 Tax=Crossiella sp. SN42 TaxID=2944808 RepID=UPI00207CA903|nr:hypothetical protein [Crossiella sp. SN42]MCO1581227.1 hypothetical protein [Crossiella sp. SN42]
MAGWFTTNSKSAPTVRDAAKRAAGKQVDKVKRKISKGNVCIVCDRPLAHSAAKSNVHPRCARAGGALG